MDSNELEKERGITILSKCTSVVWTPPPDSPAYPLGKEWLVNIVDTPGHADFGGEVERIMSMVDGVALVVCATEGPMTQTKFVLSKALAAGLRPFVVINKVDRDTQRTKQVVDEIFDLFIALGATDVQLDFPFIYASAREKWAINDWSSEKDNPAPEARNVQAIFDTIVQHVPAPVVNEDPNAPFKMLVTQIEPHSHFGKCLIGRVVSGKVTSGEFLNALDSKGNVVENIRVLKLLTRRGMESQIIETASAGDIVSIAGFDKATVNATLCHPSVTEPIASTPIDPPTLSVYLSPNTSPFAGKEGKQGTANDLRERLRKEAETNVSIQLKQSSEEAFEICGRGEMQLGVIFETMRREKFEFSISPPKVVFRTAEDGTQLEPIEEVVIDCKNEHSGQILEKMAARKGELKEFTSLEKGRSKLIFLVPTRGFLGYQSEFQTDTAGTAVMNHTFHAYEKYKGSLNRSPKGAIISQAQGECTSYALESLQTRGSLFVGPGDKVYSGMVIGESARGDNMEVNPTKLKHLSNVRSTSKEEKVKLTPAIKMSLEQAICYCRDDEIIEVTPESIRLRKAALDLNERLRLAKSSKQAAGN